MVQNATLDLCLSIADVIFWQGLAIYFSEMLELCSTFFPFYPIHGAKRNMVGISEWGFHETFVAVTREVANTFVGANASLETYLKSKRREVVILHLTCHLTLFHYDPVLPHSGNTVLARKPNNNRSCTASVYQSLVNVQCDEIMFKHVSNKAPPPPEISQTTRPISKFQTSFYNPVRKPSVQGQKFDLEVTDDVTGQVKVRILDFSGLMTSANKISMLSANNANESAWIVSLTSVSIISCAL